ncbi:hypothetical protein PMI01_03457 [Caulobacter sp. AP07]|uniref:hypothetical protein n=1 Tax=Caulobacter sp. AP07 TaxID=1144304 RepID=UPI000271DA28|nr:hypothetical protein [Caulobacter sp. AP07]EJL28794.1 hypothetical protein PMI01_03457 [Caulobacter sp. AP07]
MVRLALAPGAAAIAAASMLSVASVARASGNEHVIDDSVVETPGVCHQESWATRFGPRHGLVNLSPACTRKAWPNLEIGGAVQRTWADGTSDTTVGPALKYTLRAEDTGVGLGVIGAGAWSVGSGRLETASLIVPVTLRLNDRVRVNLNAGWSHARADARPNAAFYGAQAEVGVARDVTVMVEAFQRDGGKAGGQAGLRWNPGGGRFDLDLIAGRRIDGATPRAVTLGLTLRH